MVYRIAGKFGGELNLALWRIDIPTAKLKIRQYLICTYIRIHRPAGPPMREAQPHNNGCGRSRMSALARAYSQLFLVFDMCML